MKWTQFREPQAGWKTIVSTSDAGLAMAIAGAVAAGTTALTVAGILTLFSGPAVLTLPLATDNHEISGLALGATGHATAMELTLPAVPSGPAVQLAWGAALNQAGVLAVLGVVFLLAYRLRSRVLITPRSGWIVATGGVFLAVANAAGQVLDGIGRSRLAEMAGINRLAGESNVFAMDFNTAPMILGVALVLLGGVLQSGGRLQKDTEGLV